MDVNPRQVIAFHVGDHSPDSAKELWAKIPLVYREQATCHTDWYEAYQGMIPTVRHKAITKNARKTNHIGERGALVLVDDIVSRCAVVYGECRLFR
jgi:insertion element IS1 protein InsB